jgi:hypothetical protein
MAHTVVASGLEEPWGLALLPDGRWLVTERPGRLRIITAAGAVSEPVGGLPAVDARGQGGLLDVVTGPTFGQDRLIYWSYAEPREGGNGTAVARGRLSDDGSRVEGVQVLFRATPTYNGDKHFGASLAFAPDGKLFVTLGERSDAPMRPQAQDLASHMGKTIRINAAGTVPSDDVPAAEGPSSSNEFAFRHYNPDEVVMGKRMEDHLRFAVAYWHSFAYQGGDPFGGQTLQRPWFADTMAAARGRSRRRAMASAVREMPGSRLSRTPSDATAAPTRTTGASPGTADPSTTTRSGAVDPRSASSGMVPTTTTPTARYTVATTPSAIGTARGMVRSGSRTSSPRVAMRA